MSQKTYQKLTISGIDKVVRQDDEQIGQGMESVEMLLREAPRRHTTTVLVQVAQQQHRSRGAVRELQNAIFI